jgi:hypothetical protein
MIECQQISSFDSVVDALKEGETIIDVLLMVETAYVNLYVVMSYVRMGECAPVERDFRCDLVTCR